MQEFPNSGFPNVGNSGIGFPNVGNSGIGFPNVGNSGICLPQSRNFRTRLRQWVLINYHYWVYACSNSEILLIAYRNSEICSCGSGNSEFRLYGLRNSELSGIPDSNPMISGIPNPESEVSGIPNLDLRTPESYQKSGIPVSIPEVVQHWQSLWVSARPRHGEDKHMVHPSREHVTQRYNAWEDCAVTVVYLVTHSSDLAPVHWKIPCKRHSGTSHNWESENLEKVPLISDKYKRQSAKYISRTESSFAWMELLKACVLVQRLPQLEIASLPSTWLLCCQCTLACGLNDEYKLVRGESAHQCAGEECSRWRRVMQTYLLGLYGVLFLVA